MALADIIDALLLELYSPGRGKTVANSLSIVLPVRNAEATLQKHLLELLEVLHDLRAAFEVLVVDDASDDQTEEVAIELAKRYPQVRLFRASRQQGHAAAIQAGLARATGDVVFVQEEPGRISSHDLRRLWDMRNDEDLVMARAQPKLQQQSPQALDPKLIGQLMQWGEALQDNTDGMSPIQMIRRNGAVEAVQTPSHNAEKVKPSRLREVVSQLRERSQPVST